MSIWTVEETNILKLEKSIAVKVVRQTVHQFVAIRWGKLYSFICRRLHYVSSCVKYYHFQQLWVCSEFFLSFWWLLSVSYKEPAANICEAILTSCMSCAKLQGFQRVNLSWICTCTSIYIFTSLNLNSYLFFRPKVKMPKKDIRIINKSW